MNSPYRYSDSNMERYFNVIRVATLWAGFLGVLQSIAWMGLTVTGIVSYNCIVEMPQKYTFGSMVESVFLFTYFRSDGCTPKPTWSYSLLRSVHTILDPKDILIWDSVYLGFAVCWLLASTLLLIYVRKDNVKLTAGVMIVWSIFTGCICVMDLGLGIIFGIDYNAFRIAADKYNLSTAAGDVNVMAATLIGGMVSAISLMILSLKGFVLWIVNFWLMAWLFRLAMRALEDNDGNDSLFISLKDSDDILTTRPPIRAYEEETAYNNVGYVPDISGNPLTETIEINMDSIERAARISTDLAPKVNRFRNIDSYKQYSPSRNFISNNFTNNNNVNVSKPRSIISASSAKENDFIEESSLPSPDYTPPMSRAYQSSTKNNGNLRNQRY